MFDVSENDIPSVTPYLNGDRKDGAWMPEEFYLGDAEGPTTLLFVPDNNPHGPCLFYSKWRNIGGIGKPYMVGPNFPVDVDRSDPDSIAETLRDVRGRYTVDVDIGRNYGADAVREQLVENLGAINELLNQAFDDRKRFYAKNDHEALHYPPDQRPSDRLSRLLTADLDTTAGSTVVRSIDRVLEQRTTDDEIIADFMLGDAGDDYYIADTPPQSVGATRERMLALAAHDHTPCYFVESPRVVYDSLSSYVAQQTDSSLSM